MSNKNELWSSKRIFIFAAVGSAVGLGNMWKFPYITGENGGGAFVLVYLACILLIGLPILIAEISIGRHSQLNPDSSYRHWAIENKSSERWRYLGLLGIIAGFLVLTFYSVIGGWSLHYVYQELTWAINKPETLDSAETFSQLITHGHFQLLWHTLFMLCVIICVANGVKKGLEALMRFAIPFMFILLIILLAISIYSGMFSKGLTFLFKPDFSQLTPHSVLIALGHAFFTLSLGLGAMVIYGAYLDKKHRIAPIAVVIVIADTAIALVMGLIIFPILFLYQLEPAQGPGLLFISLPLSFQTMIGGHIAGVLFFTLVFITALTSAVSILEPGVTWLRDKTSLSKSAVTWIAGLTAWLIGVGCALSLGPWQDIHIFMGKNIFDSLDFITSSVMLPLGGLLTALYMGFVIHKSSIAQELSMQPSSMPFTCWYICIKYIAPIGIAFVFIDLILSL